MSHTIYIDPNKFVTPLHAASDFNAIGEYLSLI